MSSPEIEAATRFMTQEAQKLDQATHRPVEPVQLTYAFGASYRFEAGRQGDHVLYHFFPKENVRAFDARLEQALLEIFLFPEILEKSYEPEIGSYTVHILGGSLNPAINELTTALLRRLDALQPPL
jgi:hypothetical protein